MEPAACTIDGFGPLPMVRPTTVAELGDVVRHCAADQQAVYPVGGQTQLDLGNPPTKPGIAVDLRGLDQVIDFPARDMTITVQAGITVAKLQALLAPENLRLPIDVPQPERATLGGILATNVSGPRRLGYGTLRDYVIGISAVNDEGNEFKAGGRVVKNVAGYDLCKLLVGSLGTLGIITQVTLKLRPLAEETALISLDSADDNLADLLERIHASRTRPVCVELLDQRAAQDVFVTAKTQCPDAPWIVIVGYEGNADAVNWQVQQLVKEMGSCHSLVASVGAPSVPLWDALVRWPVPTADKVLIKLNTLPSRVAETCRTRLREAGQPSLRAHAGNGIIYLLRKLTDANPVANSNNNPGAPPADLWLMQQVKKQFDPKGLFNPGRFVGGI